MANTETLKHTGIKHTLINFIPRGLLLAGILGLATGTFDLVNTTYNPAGIIKGVNDRFPAQTFPDAEFAGLKNELVDQLVEIRKTLDYLLLFGSFDLGVIGIIIDARKKQKNQKK